MPDQPVVGFYEDESYFAYLDRFDYDDLAEASNSGKPLGWVFYPNRESCMFWTHELMEYLNDRHE